MHRRRRRLGADVRHPGRDGPHPEGRSVRGHGRHAQDGKIAAVGPDVQVPRRRGGGRHRQADLPGMFDAISELGLTEVGAVDVTNDSREQGDYKPQLQAATAVIRPPSTSRGAGQRHHPRHRGAPGGNGAIAGQGRSSASTDGPSTRWTSSPAPAWSSTSPPGAAERVRRGFFGGRPLLRRPGGAVREVAELNEWMDAGRHVRQGRAAGRRAGDLKLEAMARVVGREMPVLLEANGERDIRTPWSGRRSRTSASSSREAGRAWKVRRLPGRRTTCG